MKKFICLALVLLTIFSLASCSCFKQGPLEEKYTYDDLNESYVVLVDYNNYAVEVHMDALQASIDNYLKKNAVEYVAKRGDNIYVDINVYAETIFTSEDGSEEKSFKGEKIEALSKANYFVKDLGSSPLPHKIETDIINAELNISDIITRKYSYDDLEDYCPEEYAGKNLYFEIKIMNKQIVEGDVVEVAFKGYRIDKEGNIQKDNKGNKVEPFSEGTDKFFPGSKLAIDDFESNLVNQTMGNEFSFYATFPDDYQSEDLKGQKVIFYATIKSVYTAPIYNDAFVKALFPDYETVANFEESLKQDYIRSEMFNYVLDESEILKYPKAEYNEHKNNIEASEASFYEAYGFTFDEYIKNAYNLTRDEYIKAQMKTEMVYYAIAKNENLEPTEAMLINERTELISYYKELYMTENKLSASEALQAAEEMVGSISDVYIYENVLFDLVGDYLYTAAKATFIDKTYVSISEKLANKSSETK